jgi:hypothetical protein
MPDSMGVVAHSRAHRMGATDGGGQNGWNPDLAVYKGRGLTPILGAQMIRISNAEIQKHIELATTPGPYQADSIAFLEKQAVEARDGALTLEDGGDRLLAPYLPKIHAVSGSGREPG